jgi:hypothetical protein
MIKIQRYPLFLLLRLTWQAAQAVLPGTDAQGKFKDAYAT